jgi:hypothetical protein
MQRLTSVQSAGLVARKAGVVPVEDSAVRMRTALSSRLGVEHALLFAIPERAGNELVWTTPADTPAVRLDKVDPARRARAVARAERLLGDIKAMAQRMLAEPGAARATAQALLAVARMPSPMYVYVAGDNPVIVLWTHDEPAPPPLPPVVAENERPRAPILAYGIIAVAAIGLGVAGMGLLQSHARAEQSVAALRQTLAELQTIDASHCRPAQPASPARVH